MTSPEEFIIIVKFLILNGKFLGFFSLKNVDELIKKYPCDFNEFKTVTSKYTRKERIPLQLAVSIVLHKNVLKKLNNYMNVKGLSDIEEAAKKMRKLPEFGI